MRNLSQSPGTRQVIKAAAFTCLALLVLGAVSVILKPARSGKDIGGSWASFREQSPGSIDVMVFGTSHAFTSIDPSTLWRDHGITSFTLAGPVQDLAVTRYYVDEALKTQHPKVIAVEMIALTYTPERFSDQFQAVNIGYMPPSASRLKAAVLATPWGHKTGVISDLWTYHGRWTDLTRADFDLAHKRGGYEYLRGWIPRAGNHAPVSDQPTVPPAPDATLTAAYQSNAEPLRAIARTCAENNIELVLFMGPTGCPGKYSAALQAGAQALSDFDNVHVLDLNRAGAIPDFEYTKDLWDSGHPNVSGSLKVSRIFGRYLTTEFRLPDHRGEKAYASWNADVAARDKYVADLVRTEGKKEKKPVASHATSLAPTP